MTVGTYDIGFDPQEGYKLLDMNRKFVSDPGSRRKRLVLSPAMKNEATLNGTQDTGVTSGAAPWWAPYPPQVLASIMQGALVRFRAFTHKESERKKWCGMVTSE